MNKIEWIKQHWRLLSLFTLVSVCILRGSCQKSKPNPNQEVINPNGGKVIEKAKSKVKNNTKSKTNELYVPPEGSITIRPKDKNKSLADVVEIKRKWYGLTLEPGLEIGVINGSFGVDVKLAYINRLGLITAVSVDQLTTKTVSPAIGVSYRLDGLSRGWLRNTEGLIEYKPLSRIPIEIGVRINL